MTLKEKATRFLNDKAPDLLEMLKTTELTKDEQLDFVEAFQFEEAGYHPVCGMTKVCFVFAGVSALMCVIAWFAVNNLLNYLAGQSFLA
mgnify:CR=1 FL=1